MEDITILLLVLSIGLFIVRYLVNKTGIGLLTIVVSICSVIATLKDEAIPSDNLMFYLIPSIFVMMVSICAIAFDTKRL